MSRMTILNIVRLTIESHVTAGGISTIAADQCRFEDVHFRNEVVPGGYKAAQRSWTDRLRVAMEPVNTRCTHRHGFHCICHGYTIPALKSLPWRLVAA